MSRRAYDDRYDPPAPVVVALVGPPGSFPDVAVSALVDTGADRSVVPVELARALDLPVIDSIGVRTVAGESRARVHAMTVILDDAVVDVRVVAAGDEVLVGRDLLSRFVVTLDGPSAELEIGV